MSGTGTVCPVNLRTETGIAVQFQFQQGTGLDSDCITSPSVIHTQTSSFTASDVILCDPIIAKGSELLLCMVAATNWTSLYAVHSDTAHAPVGSKAGKASMQVRCGTTTDHQRLRDPMPK